MKIHGDVCFCTWLWLHYAQWLQRSQKCCRWQVWTKLFRGFVHELVNSLRLTPFNSTCYYHERSECMHQSKCTKLFFIALFLYPNSNLNQTIHYQITCKHTIFDRILIMCVEANAPVNFRDFRENYLNAKTLLDSFCQNGTNSL